MGFIQRTPIFGLHGWIHGDFMASGTAPTAGDYAIIDNNYLHQSGHQADGEIALHTQWFGAAYTDAFNSLSAVPEPTTLGLLALGSAALLRRRGSRTSR